MGSSQDNWGCDDDDDVSVIGDKGEIGFIDFQDDKSVVEYNPDEEGPVVISVPFHMVDGKPQSVFVGEIAVNPITITNRTDEAIDLWTKIFASNPENTFTLSVIRPPSADESEGTATGFKEFYTLEDRMVQPGDTLTIWLSCKPTEIGLCTCVVHFDVENVRTERVVFLMSEDRISQSLASRTPFSRGSRKKQFSVDRFVIGSRPQRVTDQTYKNRLPRYDIPKDLRETIESKQIPDAVAGALSRENYEYYFKTLIVMEEIKMEENMRAYNMERVNMRRKAGFLTLLVPGLAERRPSLVHGDYIIVKSAEASEIDPPFQGFIHRVETDEVYLKFAPEFHLHHSDRNLYNVHFTYNRSSMRRLYQAIDATKYLDSEILFPLSSCQRRCIDTTPLVPISCSINEEQMLSIEMILGLKGGSPYVIHGPPGTGKTMTIVEAILQLYINRKNARILACAPSNSAADNLLEKILSEEAVDVKENEIFRLNASSRSLEDVKPEHIRYCFFDEFVFKCPPLHALTRYKIIISTYMSASLLHAEGVKPGHFSHIFLDEAGQASEPDTMVPMSNLCVKKTAVILSGDPMQLGPVVYSRDAETCGLGKSYLERLFEFEPYRDEDENYVTKLVRNYRCHPDILYLPSSLFYGGELIASRESIEDTNDLLSSVNLIQGNNFPVIFFGVQGCDEREGSNPSWFNRIEASKVVDVIRKVTERGGLDGGDVGVITPYRQQVLKINKAIENLDMPDIKVGSVEQFQGQERKVIIISTVRSTVKHNEFDRLYYLGFLSNPRRFNVAVTRAISMVVVIGNPHIISKDPYWNKILWYCVDKNSYQGCDLPERQEHEAEEYEAKEDNRHGARVDDWSNYEGENHSSVAEVHCGQEHSQVENQIPGTDEAEWSDGWK